MVKHKSSSNTGKSSFKKNSCNKSSCLAAARRTWMVQARTSSGPTVKKYIRWSVRYPVTTIFSNELQRQSKIILLMLQNSSSCSKSLTSSTSSEFSKSSHLLEFSESSVCSNSSGSLNTPNNTNSDIMQLWMRFPNLVQIFRNDLIITKPCFKAISYMAPQTSL